MAMCLMWALLFISEDKVPNKEQLAHWYGEWIKSRPFDIGITTQQALHPLALKADPILAIESA